MTALHRLVSGKVGAKANCHCGFRLVSAAIVLSALYVSITGAQQYPSGSERELFDAVNQERKVHHLGVLHWNEGLALAASRHALEMVKHEAISHGFPGEASLPERLTKTGVHFIAIAENVADGPNVARLHELWMKSPHHRANILNKDMDSLGIGIVERNGQFFAVEDFGRIK
ncbi:MAG TPA: CAP domain-containing protein [Terriglobales bacterium]|nr:CAP domain-containing protein [Terriglobales bacterium]